MADSRLVALLATEAAERLSTRQLPLTDYVEGPLASPLWSKQREIIEAVERYPRVAVRSCHSAGKTHTAARLAVAYLQTHPASIVVTTAPTQRQVVNILWRYIRVTAAAATVPLRAQPGHPLQTRWDIDPDWYAIGFKGADEATDAFQGFHAADILVIVDEAAGVPEPVFDAVEAILTGTGARLLLVGNPTSTSGAFRNAFYRERDLWHTIKVSAYDTPNFTHFGITRADMLSGAWEAKVGGQPMPYRALIDPAWVARQLRRHGPDSAFVVSRIDADFPKDAGDTLIPLSALEAIDEAEPEQFAAPGTRYEAGIDVARFGSDETSIAIRQGPVYLGQESWGKLDTMQTVGRIRSVLAYHGIGQDDVTLKVDVVGIGAGVADRLSELGYDVVEVNVGAKSSDPAAWRNLRHELWWQFRELVYPVPQILTAPGVQLDEVATAQAGDVKFKYDSTHNMPVIESKDDARRRGVPSPDRAEAIMLAFAQLPEAETGPIGFAKTGRAKERQGKSRTAANLGEVYDGPLFRGR